ncbi:MAG: FeoA family protein [Candidatus Kapaibacteriota bacterium]
MTLLDAPEHKKLKITKLLDGFGLRKKLSILDVHFDDEIIKIKGARWGPIIIQKISGNSKLAIGRGIAEKIQVEIVDKDKFNFYSDEI